MIIDVSSNRPQGIQVDDKIDKRYYVILLLLYEARPPTGGCERGRQIGPDQLGCMSQGSTDDQ